jgi:Flp pilus assembly protein TadD
MNHKLQLTALVWLLFAAALPPRAVAQSASSNQKTYKIRVPDNTAADTLRAQAQAATDKKDFAGAADAWTKYLEIEPGDPYAHFQLGYADTALRKTDEAIAEYGKAAELKPDMAEAQINLGLLLLDKAPGKAIEPLALAAAAMPTEVRPRVLLGWAFERSGQADKALEQYQQAAALDPNSFDAHLFQARVLLDTNRAAEAEPEFRKALALRGDSSPAQLGLAQSLIAQKKTADAAKALDAYLQANPQDAEARTQYSSLLFGMGRTDEALSQITQAQQAGATSPDLWKLRADILIQQKNSAGAAEALAHAAALLPNDPEVHARLGRILLDLKQYPAAARESAAAFQLDPKMTDALRDLSVAHYLGGDYSGAIQVLDLLAQRELPSAGQWYIRGACLDKLDDKPNALGAYQKFLELNAGKENDEYFVASARARTLAREVKDKKK